MPGREIVGVKFKEEKKKIQQIRETEIGRIISGSERWETNYGIEIQGRENAGLQNWRYIEDK